MIVVSLVIEDCSVIMIGTCSNNWKHWESSQTELIQYGIARVPHYEKYPSRTGLSVPASTYISSKLPVTRGEEDLEDSIKELIKMIASETCSISACTNPKSPTAECNVIIFVGKFLLILNFGSNSLCNVCRTCRLGEINKSSVIHLREDDQKD